MGLTGIKKKKWVDVCGGLISPRTIGREIDHYLFHKEPERLIVDIQKTKRGYYTKIYISQEDFQKRR